MKKITFLSILLIFQFGFCFTGRAQVYPEFETDVLSYHLTIELSDSSDLIRVKQQIKAVLKSNTDEVRFDLRTRDEKGKGMEVHFVQIEDEKGSFSHKNNTLFISGLDGKAGDTLLLTVSYSGVPSDGLIIGKNKYGDRTFFGDNWPNRAHCWFACNDHPSDKATVSFEVKAPWKYQVIANGTLTEKRRLSSDENLWVYKTDYELPTKVMVIGVAEFSMVTYGPMNSQAIPVSAWVYPQSEKEGLYDMELAVSILNWFENKISSYPFDKLANVQSTTRYGGMENASCIFYDENSITGKRTMESLIAHEIAHQWFGNSASEKDWSHLWLSEGFATFLTNVYIQETKGEKAFFDQLDKDAKRVIGFNKKFPLPVVDTISSDLNFLLNANAYQKGAWVLQMLRSQIGDSLFWLSVKTYYTTYKYSNASTDDFVRIVEEVCNCPMTWFFDQWLKQSGYPIISVHTKKKKRSTILTITQHQNETFLGVLPIQITRENGADEWLMVLLNSGELPLNKEKKMTFKLPYQAKDILLDPNRQLLFERR